MDICRSLPETQYSSSQASEGAVPANPAPAGTGSLKVGPKMEVLPPARPHGDRAPISWGRAGSRGGRVSLVPGHVNTWPKFRDDRSTGGPQAAI